MTSPILLRFLAHENPRHLADTLMQQPLVGGNDALAVELAEVAELVGCPRETPIILQWATDRDLYLILTGRVSVRVSGREVATLGPGQHVGEMALVTPEASRSATVVAIEDTVVARISEPAFTALGRRYPELWRFFASELADRLRQRNQLIAPRNPLPKLLIAGTRPTLALVEPLGGLLRPEIAAASWANDQAEMASDMVDALESLVAGTDFVLLAVGPVDDLATRLTPAYTLKEKLSFELGLFVGFLGRSRVFVAVPSGLERLLPTGLLETPPMVLPDQMAYGRADALASVAATIRSVVERLGPR
jgi:CRP-like cAMP-binding protein